MSGALEPPELLQRLQSLPRPLLRAVLATADLKAGRSERWYVAHAAVDSRLQELGCDGEPERGGDTRDEHRTSQIFADGDEINPQTPGGR